MGDEVFQKQYPLARAEAERLGLSCRITNCLILDAIELGGFVQMSRLYSDDELLKFHNFGKKSLAEFRAAISAMSQ